MELRVALMPQLAGDVTRSVCIVVDALRATSVIATLFERNCPRVYVAATHDTARAFARQHGFVLCGETGGYKVPDFDYGNSPTEFASLDFTGRPVVLSTTNGTKATAQVRDAAKVFFGAALNRTAVAKAAWSMALQTGTDICVVCSGTHPYFTLEDATVAGLIVEAIAAQAGLWETPRLDDAAIVARRLWQSEPNLLRGFMEGNHAVTLADRGFGADIGFCATVDTMSWVPTLVNEGGASGVPAPVVLVSDIADRSGVLPESNGDR